MLLVSNFHDYYDSAFGYGGVDKTTVFTRYRTVEEYMITGGGKNRTKLDDAWFNPVSSSYWSTVYHSTKYVKVASLWFCGKEYPIHAFIDPDKIDVVDYYYGGIDDDDIIQYRYDNYIDHRYLGTPKKNRFFKNYSNPFGSRLNHVCDHSQNQRVSDDINIKYNSPVVLIGTVNNDQFYRERGYEVIVNPNLKDIGFTRIMGSYEAFQEINMYLNGALCVNADAVPEPLDEKTNLLKHGMDKRSFKH